MENKCFSVARYRTKIFRQRKATWGKAELLFNDRKILIKLAKLFQGHYAYYRIRATVANTWERLYSQLCCTMWSSGKASTLVGQQSHSHSGAAHGERLEKSSARLRGLETESITLPEAVAISWRHYSATSPNYRLLGICWSIIGCHNTVNTLNANDSAQTNETSGASKQRWF